LAGKTEIRKQLIRTKNEFAGTLRNVLKSKTIPVKSRGGA
jgi:hypothetical protein